MTTTGTRKPSAAAALFRHLAAGPASRLVSSRLCPRRVGLALLAAITLVGLLATSTSLALGPARPLAATVKADLDDASDLHTSAPVVVPEPATLLFAGAAGLALFGRRRFRRIR
jgi:hypothetical protein